MAETNLVHRTSGQHAEIVPGSRRARLWLPAGRNPLGISTNVMPSTLAWASYGKRGNS
jgi:hypothetical protein